MRIKLKGAYANPAPPGGGAGAAGGQSEGPTAAAPSTSTAGTAISLAPRSRGSAHLQQGTSPALFNNSVSANGSGRLGVGRAAAVGANEQEEADTANGEEGDDGDDDDNDAEEGQAKGHGRGGRGRRRRESDSLSDPEGDGEADEQFVNAPLDLPDSSGDEYKAPRSQARFSGSAPRARGPGSRGGRGSRGGGRGRGRGRGSRGRGRGASQLAGSLSPRPPSRRASTRRAAAGGDEDDDDAGSNDDEDDDEGEDGDDDEVDGEELDDDEAGPSRSRRALPTRGRGSRGGRRGRPPLPRDAHGNIVHPNRNGARTGRGRRSGTDDAGGDSNDDENTFDEEDGEGLGDEDDDGMLRSGQSTPGGSQISTDGRRRRGGWRGGRGGAVGVSSSRQIKGATYRVVNEELGLPIDEEGEKKVDAQGRLLGGREYKAVTFKSPTREDPERLYMLAIDAARCAGFRDSLYFFRRNPWIHKLNCTQDEKEILISMKRLHINLRSRQVTIVTARNCFRVFGARFVKKGKNVTDDYYEAAAIAKGLEPGSPAYVESYHPDIDNTTLAMPKIGNFAKPLGQGRPAYMKMARAMEFAQAPLGSAPPDGSDERERQLEKERQRRQKEEDEEEAAFLAAGGKRSAFAALRIPTTALYKGAEFGLVQGAALPQFGGNGMAPFGDAWEKSKARKPAPFLNGINWMLEFAKATSKNNAAILGVRREYNAYHRMTLGNDTTRQDREEEQGGVWELSGDENEYETMEEYRTREGLLEKLDRAETDDRGRGRTPDALLDQEQKDGDDMDVDATEVKPDVKADRLTRDGMAANSTSHPDSKDGEGGVDAPPKKKQRRRRSPVRGFYENHTRQPQIRLDTQPTRVVEYEKLDFSPHFVDTHAGDVDAVDLKKAAALAGVSSTEYGLVGVSGQV